ncbi:Homoserine kinase [Planococcus massiliensis]|uniref:Homoserine kinase n=1 Tax=Planococcus massiliensis TaxID=1499687 RepID=A0A098EPQ6_9BACL|nr:aminoglycoside phosphotransferase family protein [Planococcus massiliensis]CEG24269.1 Homoserine kinase [Planococcus massiliensis]
MDQIYEVTSDIKAWLQKSLGAKSEIKELIPLKGGTSSHLFEFTAVRDGRFEPFVLRLFTLEEWLAMEPDLAKHEAASLREAGKTGLTVPEIVAFDETGEFCGVPAVLMTKISGEVVLQPDDEKHWLKEMAAALSKIHLHKAEGFGWEYFAYNDALKMERPVWSSCPDEWMRAFRIVAGIRPHAEFCLIHRDYHPTNVLWEGAQISGIVDWVNACRGPAGIDVGHCRLNLALLYGIPAADGFLAAYEQAAGEKFTYHPYWDLSALVDFAEGTPTVYPGWTAFGVAGLTDELMRHRFDGYLLNLLKRFDR